MMDFDTRFGGNCSFRTTFKQEVVNGTTISREELVELIKEVLREQQEVSVTLDDDGTIIVSGGGTDEEVDNG